MEDKRQTSRKVSGIDALPGEYQLLEHAPIPLAVTSGASHALVFANAAFRAISATLQAPVSGRAISDFFEAAVSTRLAAMLDRALRENSALRDQFLGPLEATGRPWNCTVWPIQYNDAMRGGLVVELGEATHAEATLSLQREVAERLLLSALRGRDEVEDARASQERAAFLATAGRELSESLDTDTIRQRMAGLTLPALAEWCIVDLLEPDGAMRRLTIIHGDPRKQALASQLQNQWAPEPGDLFGLPAVLRSAQPVLIADKVDQALAQAAHDSATFRTLRDLGIGALLTVPLTGESRVMGAITFMSGERDRAFTPQDIELAEGLAARSALALEKARLYGEALVMKNKAEDAARTTTRFLGTISHELRTPMQAISGYVELIARGIHGPVTDAQRVDLEHILTSQRHLLVLIGELLDFMRIGSGHESYQTSDVHLDEAITRALELSDALLSGHGLACTIKADCAGVVAAADPDRVHQILLNLITNAVKFTGQGGKITIGCKSEPGYAVVQVADTGRGIPHDKLELIFEPFVQAYEEDARTHGGIGLGLAISRDLARAMGGDLTVESTPGKGSTFTLTLPRAV